MAYYIDETKKTAVKYEGKNAFAWNTETRKFDLPVSEVSPKSRMMRCSVFEARRYLFESDPAGYEAIGDELLHSLNEMPEREPKDNSTIPEAEAFLRESEEDCAKIKPLIEKYRAGIRAFVMEDSGYGRLLSMANHAVESVMTIAGLNLKSAQLSEEIARRQDEINFKSFAESPISGNVPRVN